jgi:hypothetical protein
MNGLLVIIEGSRRHWRVTADDGNRLTLTWHGETRMAYRSEVLQRREPGIGWVTTRIPALSLSQVQQDVERYGHVAGWR